MDSALPAGPTGRWRTTAQLVRDSHGAYAAWRARFGDTFTVDAMNGKVVLSCDPAFAADVYALKSDRHRPFAADALTPLLGSGSLLLLFGAAHQRERKLLMPPFHGARMRAYGDQILAITRARAARWQPGQPLRMADELLAISIEVIVRAVFGVQSAAEVERWNKAIGDLVAALNPVFLFFPKLQRAPLGLGPWARFTSRRDALDALIAAKIAERRASGARGDDILSLLLDATYDDGAPMPDSAVRDELVTLLFAGHETTQITMAWAIYRLNQHPDALARLRAGLDALVVDEAGHEAEQLAKDPYLSAVCDETLRHDVVVSDVLRTLTAEATLGGLTLPAGTNIGVAITTIHHRPDLFPAPEQWSPERFLDKSYPPSVFMPFGGGTRRCVGAALANYELRLVLGVLARDHQFSLAGDEVPVRRNATIGPKNGVRVRYLGPRGAT